MAMSKQESDSSSQALKHPAPSPALWEAAEWLQWLFPLANLPTVFTGEISGDKQLLLHIKSIVCRCWNFFSPGIFHFQSIKAELQIHLHKGALNFVWIFSFCIHLFSMRQLLWDDPLRFNRISEQKIANAAVNCLINQLWNWLAIIWTHFFGFNFLKIVV